jgi:hypothetical protein
MRRALLGALLALAAAPAAADPLPTPPPGGVIVSADGRTVISSTLCAELGGAAAGVPPADYKPGVDVDGHAVAPANLPSGAPPPALENFPIEIDAKLTQRFNVPAQSRLFRGKAIVGLVTVRDGRAYFNGEPIGDNERDLMIAACRERKR